METVIQISNRLFRLIHAIITDQNQIYYSTDYSIHRISLASDYTFPLQITDQNTLRLIGTGAYDMKLVPCSILMETERTTTEYSTIDNDSASACLVNSN